MLRVLGNHLVTGLRSAGVHVPSPEGGFYLFCDFSGLKTSLSSRGIHTATALCERALEDVGVAFLPGSAFGMVDSVLTARMAYVDFDGRVALEHGDDDAAILKACGRTVEAVDRLCAWLGS